MSRQGRQAKVWSLELCLKVLDFDEPKWNSYMQAIEPGNTFKIRENRIGNCNANFVSNIQQALSDKRFLDRQS